MPKVTYVLVNQDTGEIHQLKEAIGFVIVCNDLMCAERVSLSEAIEAMGEIIDANIDSGFGKKTVVEIFANSKNGLWQVCEIKPLTRTYNPGDQR